MKTSIYYIVLISFLLMGCNDILDQKPQGTVSSEDLNTPETVEQMVIAAYSALGNEVEWTPFNLWPLGGLRGGDAYKGGDAASDNIEWYHYEIFKTNQTDNERTDQLWSRLYEAIGRVNDALTRLNAISDTQMTTKKQRIAEMKFIRGHFYFLLKVVYKHFPYFDETIPHEEYDNISNRQYSNDALWDKVASEFIAASEVLPETQAQVGRPTKFAALAYLAKTRLYQAYISDEDHNITSIDKDKLNEVVRLCDEVIKSGKYGLNPDFAHNFLPEYENSQEAIFSVQYSVGDGTPHGRVNMGYALNYPMTQEYGCCGIYRPSQNLVNAFKTDANGLPKFDTFNNEDATENDDFLNQTFDPRLDHTVSIPGHPFKYKPDFVYQKGWARSPQIYGYYASMKELVAYDSPAFQKVGPFMGSSMNFIVLRYDDLLLWKAEALIELDRYAEALPIINQIRTRAGNSTSLLKQSDGSYTSNYKIGIYEDGKNIQWNKANAQKVLRWERRLEFAMENCRFFDLVRWGIADTYINEYFKTESKKVQYLQTAEFKKSRDEYLPIPMNQMNYSRGVYTQNKGW